SCPVGWPWRCDERDALVAGGQGSRLRFTRSRREALDQFSAAMAARFAGESESSDPEAIGMPLGEILVAQDYITEEQRDAALARQAQHGGRFGEILVRSNLLKPRDIAMALAAQMGLRTIDLARSELDMEVTARLPAEAARELQAVPLGVQGDRGVGAWPRPRIRDPQPPPTAGLRSPTPPRGAAPGR